MLMNQLQNQLRANNPKVFQQFEQFKNSNGNPQEFLKQITNGYTPEQRKAFSNFAKGFGVTDEQLNQFGIDTK